MKDFLGYLLISVLFIAMVVVLIQIKHDKANMNKCLESEYKTKDYKMVNNKLYCRSSENSYQILRK